jgi:hypothetical protein
MTWRFLPGAVAVGCELIPYNRGNLTNRVLACLFKKEQIGVQNYTPRFLRENYCVGAVEINDISTWMQA